MLKSKMSEKAFTARKKFDNFNYDDPQIIKMPFYTQIGKVETKPL